MEHNDTNFRKNMKKKAIIVLSKKGFELAKTISNSMDNVEIFAFRDVGLKVSSKYSFSKVSIITKKIFNNYDLIIYIMATGIVVRSIAEFLKDKRKDPAVLVIDEMGNFIISLLSGHIGGANDYARFLATIILGATPVITTASDVNDKPSVDLVFEKHGFYVENLNVLSKISYRIINEKKVFVYDKTNVLKEDLSVKGVDFVSSLLELKKIKNKDFFCIFVSTKNIHEFSKYKNCLTVRPKAVVLGIGCKRGVFYEEVEGKILKLLREENISINSIKNLSTIDIKKDEVAINEFSRKYKIPVRYFSKNELNSVSDKVKKSSRVKKLIGVDGVCEQSVILSGVSVKVKKKRLENLTLALGVES